MSTEQTFSSSCWRGRALRSASARQFDPDFFILVFALSNSPKLSLFLSGTLHRVLFLFLLEPNPINLHCVTYCLQMTRRTQVFPGGSDKPTKRHLQSWILKNDTSPPQKSPRAKPDRIHHYWGISRHLLVGRAISAGQLR